MAGAGEGGRPPLLLLAGLMCAADVWGRVADLLADVADPIPVDFAGCRTMGEMAERVLARAPARFLVAGHSMGGRVALEVHRRAPERVARVALLNTGAHPVGAAEPETRGKLLALARAEGMAAVAEAWLPPMLGTRARGDATLVGEMRAMMIACGTEAFAGQVNALLTRPDATPQLPRLGPETLFLSSAEDGWSPTAQHRAMAEAVPGATLVELADCGHMSIVECPEQVAAALRAWILRPAG